MNRTFLCLASALLLVGCQDEVVSSSDSSAGSPRVVSSGYARVLLDGRTDSSTALVIKIDSAKDTLTVDNASLKVGTLTLSTYNGGYLLPIPDTSEFCGGKVVFDIETRKGHYSDTLHIHGTACDDSTAHVVVAAKDSSIVYYFQDTGATFHDSTGKFPATASKASWNSDSAGFFLKAPTSSIVDFGDLVKDGTSEGSVELLFRPDSAFRSIPARTIFGNDGGRIHIGWANGQIFFQKNHDNLHRFISSDTGLLKDLAWHRILATWGPQGMTLALDGRLIAWSSDVSGYHSATTQSNNLRIGGKSHCCMEPELVTSAINASGSYRYLRLGFKQPKVWSDSTAHACVERNYTAIPSCGTTAPSYVQFPIW